MTLLYAIPREKSIRKIHKHANDGSYNFYKLAQSSLLFYFVVFSSTYFSHMCVRESLWLYLHCVLSVHH
nr:MAG TPA: hypothetical protein [Caudoviricetes sp.]